MEQLTFNTTDHWDTKLSRTESRTELQRVMGELAQMQDKGNLDMDRLRSTARQMVMWHATTYVAGTKFRPAIVARLVVGDELALFRDPMGAYANALTGQKDQGHPDPWAVLLCAPSENLTARWEIAGYIPKLDGDGQPLAELYSRALYHLCPASEGTGVLLAKATVRYLTGGGDRPRGLRVQLPTLPLPEVMARA